jgi:hypothetical protein
MLEKSKPLTSSITRRETIALRSLEDNKEIGVIQADENTAL